MNITCTACSTTKDYMTEFYAGSPVCTDCQRAAATARRKAALPPAPKTYPDRRYSGTCDLCGAVSDDLRLRPHLNMAAYICNAHN